MLLQPMPFAFAVINGIGLIWPEVPQQSHRLHSFYKCIELGRQRNIALLHSTPSQIHFCSPTLASAPDTADVNHQVSKSVSSKVTAGGSGWVGGRQNKKGTYAGH